MFCISIFINKKKLSSFTSFIKTHLFMNVLVHEVPLHERTCLCMNIITEFRKFFPFYTTRNSAKFRTEYRIDEVKKQTEFRRHPSYEIVLVRDNLQDDLLRNLFCGFSVVFLTGPLIEIQTGTT